MLFGLTQHLFDLHTATNVHSSEPVCAVLYGPCTSSIRVYCPFFRFNPAIRHGTLINSVILLKKINKYVRITADELVAPPAGCCRRNDNIMVTNRPNSTKQHADRVNTLSYIYLRISVCVCARCACLRFISFAWFRPL